jgi:hypothetical protein
MVANEIIKTVCVFDPALVGADAKVVEKFSKNRDLSILQPYIKPSEVPAVYSVKRIDHLVFLRQCLGQTNDEMKAVRAFQFGVVSIENMRNADGSRVNWEPSGLIGETRYVTETELERISIAEILEIGRFAFELSFLPRTTVGGYRLPLSSAELWDRLQAPSADANRIT